MGQKFVYSVTCTFRAYGMGNKATFPFPGGTEAGCRVDFYLPPVFDKERIGERAKQIAL